MSLFRLLQGQFWCHCQSLASPFAASFVPMAYFYAFLALPNIFGTYRVFKQSTATKWAQNVHFSTAVGPRAQPKPHIFGPRFTLLGSQNGSPLRLFGTYGRSKRPKQAPKQNEKHKYASTPSGPGSLLDKVTFDPFWTHLGPLFGGRV